MTADARRTPRRGTSSACATKHRQPSSVENPQSRGDASFTRSFDPFTFPSRNTSGESSGGEALSEASRSGNPAQAGGTDTGVIDGERRAARRVSPLSQGSRREA
jgi:hypothetical protein